MRKNYLTLFLLSLAVLSLVLVSTTQLSKAQSGTQVGGILWDNTTWTTANSPICLNFTNRDSTKCNPCYTGRSAN